MSNLHWLPKHPDLRSAIKAIPAEKSNDEQLSYLRWLAGHQLNFTEVIKLDSRLQAIVRRAPEAIAPFPKIRLAILASSTVDHLQPAIRVAAFRRGVVVETYVAPYGQYRQEILNSASGLYSFAPDVVLLALESTQTQVQLPLEASWEEAEASVEQYVAEWSAYWRTLMTQLGVEPPLGWPSGSLAYAASVENLDDRFNLVQISSDLRVGITPIGQVTIQAFIRPNSPTVSHQSLGAILPPSKRLNGKVALVIGGSRGLGAAISGVLAQQGCTTVVNFLRSEAEALRLQTTLKAAAGEVALFQGDASALAWCEAALHKIEAAYGRLDYLICNACPPILPMWLEPSAVARINSYIEKSLALMSTPMAAFLEILSAHRGWNIAISSIYATEQAPADLPQYIAAKSAIEGLVKAASLEYEKVHHCIVRPPKLLTDQTNTPLSRQGAIAPEVVAAELVKTLMDSQVPKPLSILERFPSAPVRRH